MKNLLLTNILNGDCVYGEFLQETESAYRLNIDGVSKWFEKNIWEIPTEGWL